MNESYYSIVCYSDDRSACKQNWDSWVLLPLQSIFKARTKAIVLENVLHRLLVMFMEICVSKLRPQACNPYEIFCFTPWVLPQLNQDKEGNIWDRKWSVRNYFLLNQRGIKTLLWLIHISFLALLGFVQITT